MKILVTGAAGFIGFHLVQRLMKEGHQIVGLDNINDYYDVKLKYARLAETGIYSPLELNHNGGENRTYQSISFGEQVQSITYPDYSFIRLNLEDKAEIENLFREEQFEVVVNLAAQAGVRYSIENPNAYIQSNIVGFLNILEACRHNPVKHLLYASSSSVYGANAKIPFAEDDQVDHPVSLYAATKKSNELMAHTYSHLYEFQTTGLRFFTVYGPWGRPDMAPLLFADAITKGNPIKIFNNGEMERDFTFIDDIIEGIKLILRENPNSKPQHSIYNIGNGSPVNLMNFIKTLEDILGIVGQKIMQPMQPGDVQSTWADISLISNDTGYAPKVPLRLGVSFLSKWHNDYYLNMGK